MRDGLLGVTGAAADCTFTLGRDHWATEQHLRSTSMAFTFLRDNLYADFLPLMVGEDGVIRGPAGGGDHLHRDRNLRDVYTAIRPGSVPR